MSGNAVEEGAEGGDEAQASNATQDPEAKAAEEPEIDLAGIQAQAQMCQKTTKVAHSRTTKVVGLEYEWKHQILTFPEHLCHG